MHFDFTIPPVILRLLAMVGVVLVLLIAAAITAHFGKAERLKVPAAVFAVTLMLVGLYWLVERFI